MLVAVQALGYPLVVWLAWIWLGIAESRVIEIVGSVVLGGGIIAAIAWLLASAFDATLRVRVSWVRSLAFVITALVIAGAGWWLTRRVYPIALVALLIPPLYARSWRVLGNWQYWAAILAFAGVGLYLPWRTATWVPAASSFAAQAASMAVRFLIAYLVAVASLLAFAAVVRRLAHRTQPTPAA